MHAYRRRTMNLWALIFAVALLVDPVATNAASKPEDAVWEYIDKQIEAGARDSTLWKRRWHIEGVLTREDARLGEPFSSLSLNSAQALELFVSSGDLVGSASLGAMSYPVFRKKELIATVQVSEDGGRWTFAGRHLIGHVDSLVTARTERGEKVAILVANALGAFVVITPAASSEMRVYPLSRNAALDEKKGKDGTISYPTACEILRPQADDWLKNHGRSSKQKEQR